MFASLLLTFREGLEAALIVGIILGYLNQIGHSERHRTVWWAVGSAVGRVLRHIVVVVGLSFRNTHSESQSTSHAIFNR